MSRGLPLRDGKMDGRFTALTAELFAGNVGAPSHWHGCIVRGSACASLGDWISPFRRHRNTGERRSDASHFSARATEKIIPRHPCVTERVRGCGYELRAYRIPPRVLPPHAIFPPHRHSRLRHHTHRAAGDCSVRFSSSRALGDAGVAAFHRAISPTCAASPHRSDRARASAAFADVSVSTRDAAPSGSGGARTDGGRCVAAGARIGKRRPLRTQKSKCFANGYARCP